MNPEFEHTIERRARSLWFASAFAAVTLVLVYPIVIAADGTVWRLLLIHASTLFGMLCAQRRQVDLGAWTLFALALFVLLENGLDPGPVRTTVYWLAIPVAFASATLSARGTYLATVVTLLGLGGVYAFRGFPGGQDGLRIAAAAVVTTMVGSLVAVSSAGFERLLDDLLESQAKTARATRLREEAEVERASSAAADAAKSAFLASMSHELRTPLNAILGYAELIGEELEDRAPSSMADLERITRAGTHLRRLIDDVLDLSKIEAGRMEFHFEQTELTGLLEEAARTTAPLVARRANTLVMAESSASVWVDRTRLLQVLLNLIGNSAKFTDGGTVSVDVLEEEGHVTLTVSDTGTGMTPDQLARAFEPFSQAEDSARPEGGTGLGLALAKGFTESMNGTLEASSDPGRGTSIALRFPVSDRRSDPASPGLRTPGAGA